MLSFKKLIIFLAVFLSVNVFAEQLIDKKQKINKPWVLGYFEGGPYSDYKKILTETVTAMMNDGLLEQKRIPAFSGEQTAELWTWLAENLSNSMITFSKDFYFSADWDEKKREKYQVEATELLINKEVELLSTHSLEDLRKESYQLKKTIGNKLFDFNEKISEMEELIKTEYRYNILKSEELLGKIEKVKKEKKQKSLAPDYIKFPN